MKRVENLRRELREKLESLERKTSIVSFDWVDKPFQSLIFGPDWQRQETDEGHWWEMRDITPGMTTIKMQQFRCEGGVLFPPHRHPDAVEYLILTEGVLHLKTTEGDVTLYPMDKIKINAGVIHSGHYPVNSSMVMILENIIPPQIPHK